jgi:hypothetical protein
MREARGFAPPPRNGFAFSWRLHYTYHPHSPSIAYLEYLESLTILNEYIPISERLISEALPPSPEGLIAAIRGGYVRAEHC